MTINNPAYKTWLDSVVNPYESITVLEKSEVSEVDLSDISEALEEYVRLFKAEIASPAEILTLSRAYPTEEKYSLAVIDKELDQNEPVVIGGPASVEVVDREGHLITLAAMKRAFERFMANFRTRNAMVLHSDVQVGWALPAYISKTGKIYKSGVTGDHLFFITELRDDTKIAKKVLEQIDTGKMKSYSIAGSATSVEAVQKSSGMVMQVNDMELAEVTICEQGVNQKAKFELMKSDADRPTSSCVDGSCLIKSQSHVHSKTELFVNDDGIIDTVGSFSNWVQKAGLYENIHARRKSGKRMRSEGDPKAPTDADFRDAARVKKGVGMTMQKSSLEQLDDHLEKSIYDDPEDRPTPEAEAAKRKMIREANEKAAGEKSVGRFAGGRFEAEDDFQRMKGKEILEMQKSHLEGCGCASCTQRTGNDDTARPATDRNGRPTLGHTGHGNAVAIIISRMQRKARTKEQQRKGQLAAANQARSKAFRGLELPDLAGNANPELKENLKRRDRSTIKFGQRQDAYDATRTPAGRRRQSYESGKEANAEIARMEMNTLGYNTKDVQKAAYEYINKSKGNPGPGKIGRSAYKDRQDTAERRQGGAYADKERDSEHRIEYPVGDTSEGGYLGGQGTSEENYKAEMTGLRREGRGGSEYVEGGRKRTAIPPSESIKRGVLAGAMSKAVYAYINKSKGNPGPGKKGRAQYKKEQGQREEKVGGTDLDTDVQEKRSYGRYRQQHPQSEEYRGGKSSLPYGSPASRLEEAKYHEHRETDYDPMDVYDAGSYPGGTLEPPDPRHNPDTTPLHRKWQANPSRYPALNTPPEYFGDKGQARGKRAKEAEAKGLGRGPDTRGMRSKSPRGGDTGRHVQSMQKAVYEYINKNNIEKGALGAIGKVVGGAAKGASKVAGGVLSAAEGLLVPGESGKSVLGNVTRVAGEAAGESKSNTPRMPGMEINMEKQAPEWTTPQTETPLHKFIDHNKGDQD
tara:strand:+ start:1493 stop:4414 length:2922 start_codon:yes stop_codon:yes gene_type:complete